MWIGCVERVCGYGMLTRCVERVCGYGMLTRCVERVCGIGYVNGKIPPADALP